MAMNKQILVVSVAVVMLNATLVGLSAYQYLCAKRAEADVARVIMKMGEAFMIPSENVRNDRQAEAHHLENLLISIVDPFLEKREKREAVATVEEEADEEATFERFTREAEVRAKAEAEAEGEPAFQRSKREMEVMAGAETEAEAEEETLFGRLRREASAIAESEAEAELAV